MRQNIRSLYKKKLIEYIDCPFLSYAIRTLGTQKECGGLEHNKSLETLSRKYLIIQYCTVDTVGQKLPEFRPPNELSIYVQCRWELPKKIKSESERIKLQRCWIKLHAWLVRDSTLASISISLAWCMDEFRDTRRVTLLEE